VSLLGRYLGAACCLLGAHDDRVDAVDLRQERLDGVGGSWNVETHGARMMFLRLGLIHHVDVSTCLRCGRRSL
jgi:hypothetical protein